MVSPKSKVQSLKSLPFGCDCGERSGRDAAKALCFFVPLLFALFFAGCAVGPNYKRPKTAMPPNFRGETEPVTNSFGDLPWWNVFPDDALQELIRTALTNNYDLRIAVTRVEQARALAQQSQAAFFPAVGYQVEAERGKNSQNGFGTANGKTASIYELTANASWEVDLWGRIRRLNESARAQYLASREAQRDVRISIISQTAQAYYQLLALDADLQIAKEATNAFGESLKIFSERLRHGVASRLETSAAEAARATAAAQIPDLERQIALQEDMINVLLGRYTGPVRRNDSSLEKLSVPDVPAGLPSDLLERRPDVRQAEQQLRSANAQVGVAIANFFPKLSLTGLLGRVSPELSAITGGAANAWSWAANFTGPLFQGGAYAAQLHQTKAAREQYWLQYQQTVLTGFREVSDALLARQYLAQARLEDERAVSAYREAVQVVIQRYREGQSSYYEVLQEQQQLFPAEESLVQTGLNQFVAIIQLYRALGGGWDEAQKQ